MSTEQKLYVWYRTINNTPKGEPLSLETSIVEKYNPKKAMQDFDFEWSGYIKGYHSFPPEGELKLPAQLSLVMKKVKEPKFDYVSARPTYKIFSKKLYDLLVKYGLTDKYEYADLTLLDKQGNNVGQQEYCLLRFSFSDDEYFDFGKEKVVESGSLEIKLYPSVRLKKKFNKSVFFLNGTPFSSFNNCLVFTEDVKKEIEELCYEPEIYPIEEFPDVYIKQMNAWKN